MKLGLAGKITGAFIDSALTPLVLITAVVFGAFALIALPREEDPQITVPFVDILINTSGLKAEDAVELVTKPFENALIGLDDVEHVYTNTRDDQVLLTVRFDTGHDDDSAIIRVNDAVQAVQIQMPQGIAPPLVIGRSVNDVAILVLTLSPKPGNVGRWNGNTLYNLAEELQHELTKSEDVGLSYIVGGNADQIRIEPDPERMSLYGVTLDQLLAKVTNANRSSLIGSLREANRTVPVLAGQTLQDPNQINLLLITTFDGRPVYLRDVANIVFGASLNEHSVWQLLPKQLESGNRSYDRLPAVSLAIAKRSGSNAVEIAKEVLNRLEVIRDNMIPAEVDVIVTRDFGRSSEEKADELLMHLVLATCAIVLIMAVFLGWREGFVIAVVIPATVLFTFFINWLLGITLNRISMGGLLFALGILADDAIVVIENISRHWKMRGGRSWRQATIEAVDEVGNPTIVATFTVVVALLPMLYSTGFSGPFLQPIPITASAAMVISLFLALIVVPWALLRLLHRGEGDQGETFMGVEDDQDDATSAQQGGVFGKLYMLVAGRLIKTPTRAKLFLLTALLITLGSFVMPYYKLAIFKIMPDDDKSDVQVSVDLPEGSSLEATERVLIAAADRIINIPEIETMQIYAGISGPFDFYGLVRQDYFRNFPEMGELRVKLTPKWERERHSHPIAMEIRDLLKDMPRPEGAEIKIVEAPPGPPAPYIIIAEIYGPDQESRRETARMIRQILDEEPSLVETDTSFGEAVSRIRISIDQDNLEYHQVEERVVYDTVAALLGGIPMGYSHRGGGRNPVQLMLKMPKQALFAGERLLSTPIRTRSGSIVELGDVVTLTTEKGSYPIYRRDGRFTDMVTAGLAEGNKNAPVYSMYEVQKILDQVEWPWGEAIEVRLAGQPEDESVPSLLWMGEWDVTRSAFADLGVAFAVALLGIYILVVGQFGSFKTPLLVLVPVPLGFSGIIVGHWIIDSPFSMPSMAGLIALSGIVVRNSILLIEFIQMRKREGIPIRQAAMEAGAIRSKPIILTAVAGIAGASFILVDPMFHGMAISLLFGLISSTVLTLLVIPAFYIWLRDDGVEFKGLYRDH